MTTHPIGLEHILERIEAMERKLDLIMHHINGLAEKVQGAGLTEQMERGENYPMKNMPQPGDLNDDIHIPGLG